MLASFDVSAYLDDYEFRGDTDYTPTEAETLLIADAIHGAIGQITDQVCAILTKLEAGRLLPRRSALGRNAG